MTGIFQVFPLIVAIIVGVIPSQAFHSVNRGSWKKSTLLYSSTEDASTLPVPNVDRRMMLCAFVVGTTNCAPVVASTSTAFLSLQNGEDNGLRLTVPIKLNPRGTAYLVYFRVDGSLFRAIVDTGSPFLMTPGSCGERVRAQWGCYSQDRGLGEPSGLDDTFEVYDGKEGPVEWRRASFAFENATGGAQEVLGVGSPFTFGVASDSLLASPGGVFFGLVRDADKRIRPSFLGQTNVKAFIVDLASTPRSLTFSTQRTIFGDYVPLTTVLRRRFGDPSGHYTAQALGVTVNEVPLGARDNKPIYVIVDTGVTGMVVDRSLFEERFVTTKRRRERSLWGRVAVTFRTALGRTLEVTAREPICTPVSALPWKGFDAACHLVVIGLSFLEGSVLSIDIDERRMWIENGDRAQVDGENPSVYRIPKTRVFS